MGSILLRNISLNDKPVDILIRDGLIQRIAEAHTIEIPQFGEVMNCEGKVVLPGFINMHTHSAMTIMRGISEDMPLKTWLDDIWDKESHLSRESVYWGTKIACLEMIRTGTTTFNDQYWFTNHAQRASAEMGTRAYLSRVVLDKFSKKEAEYLKESCLRMLEESKAWSSRSTFSAAFHSVYTVSEEMLLWTAEFARKNKLNLHIHLSETEQEVHQCKEAHGGLSPVEYLEELGILAPNVIAAHTLHLSEKDIEILGKHRVNCVHNINSNLKLSSGYKFYYKELKDAGANVCFGTDGCASSNNLDMLETLKTSALVQKAWRQDPTAMPLKELIDCATINGAKALGINAGVVQEGKLADLMIVDTENSFFISDAPFLANFIYSAHSECIDSVICDGQFVMKNRRVSGENNVIEGTRQILSTLR